MLAQAGRFHTVPSVCRRGDALAHGNLDREVDAKPVVWHHDD